MALRLVRPRLTAATSGGAGCGAAGACQSGAALPGAKPQARGTGHLRQRDIGALREQRIVLEHRPEPRQVVGVDVVDEEDAMGIAHVHHAWRIERRIVLRPERDLLGVGNGLRQRDLVPIEPRRAHVDGDAAVIVDGRGKHGALGGDADLWRAALLGEQRRDAARRIAAGANLAAVGIPDAHEHVGLRRRLERDHLIAADAVLPIGDGRDLVGPQRDRVLAQIEHDEVVAETVHLAEGEAHKTF